MSSRLLQSSGTPHPPVSTPILKQKACTACRTRKVKCDRNFPCSNCVSWRVECVYPSPVRRAQRSRKWPVQAGDGSGAVKSQRPLDARLQKVEIALQELAELVQGDDLESQPERRISAAGVGSASTFDCSIQEVMAMRNNLKIFGFKPHTLHSEPPRAQGCRLRPFGSFSLEVAPLHPSRAEALLCWRVFLENIDQLVKVLHRPSAERILRKGLMSGTSSLSKGEEALLFAIYFSSVASMRTTDAETCFKTSKNAALIAYLSATEQALMRADFLTSTDLVTLQAFVLFLSFNRFVDEAKSVWAMTGLARRLSSSAQGNLSPFEREMHRRLSWQLWFLDQRAAEDRGEEAPSPPDPELPLNVNEAELDLRMITAPISREGWTEMSFSLIRYEIASTSSKIESGPFSFSDKERMIKECRHRIQSRYLKYCDDRKPIPWLAQLSAEVMTTELRIKLHSQAYLPANAATVFHEPEGQRDNLFRTTIDIIDAKRLVEQDPLAKHWKWLLSAYLQFQPLAFLLKELCHRQCSSEMDYAWTVAETAFARWTEDSKKSGNGEVLARLMEKTKAKMKDMEMRRQSPMQAAELPPSTCPWLMVSGFGLAQDPYPAEDPTHLPSGARTESSIPIQDSAGMPASQEYPNMTMTSLLSESVQPTDELFWTHDMTASDLFADFNSEGGFVGDIYQF